jgi:hypothetical protein
MLSPAPIRTFTPFAIALVVYLGALGLMRPNTAGDEPHYLLAAESLVFDGDFELSNDYASRNRTRRVYTAFPLNLHAAHYTPSGGLRTKHGIALSVLVAPAIALGVLPARLLLIVVSAILAQQLYALLLDLGVARSTWRWLAWAAVALCPPLLVFTNQIYPEVPAALLTVVALRVILRSAAGRRAVLLGSLAAAALPWFHVRYLPIAGALFLGLLYAGPRSRRLELAAWVVGPFAVSFVLLALSSSAGTGARRRARRTGPSSSSASATRAGRCRFGARPSSPTSSTPATAGSHTPPCSGSASPGSAA